MIKSYLKKTLVLLFFLFSSGEYLQSEMNNQDDPNIQKTIQQGSVSDDLVTIIRNVEAGLLTNDIASFTKHLARHIELNLREDANGFFSSNQTHYILINFFSTRRFHNFQFTKIYLENEAPYATGGGNVIVKGKREIYQVYISLSLQDSRWVITQFNVY